MSLIRHAFGCLEGWGRAAIFLMLINMSLRKRNLVAWLKNDDVVYRRQSLYKFSGISQEPLNQSVCSLSSQYPCPYPREAQNLVCLHCCYYFCLFCFCLSNTMQLWLAWHSLYRASYPEIQESSSCLCFPSARTKDMVQTSLGRYHYCKLKCSCVLNAKVPITSHVFQCLFTSRWCHLGA